MDCNRIDKLWVNIILGSRGIAQEYIQNDPLKSPYIDYFMDIFDNEILAV
jgi:hypothetical protein